MSVWLLRNYCLPTKFIVMYTLSCFFLFLFSINVVLNQACVYICMGFVQLSFFCLSLAAVESLFYYKMHIYLPFPLFCYRVVLNQPCEHIYTLVYMV